MMCRKIALTPVLACLLAAASLISCAAQAAAPPADKMDKKKPPADKTTPVSVRVTTDKKVYAAGDSIKLTLTARNTTREDQHLTFTSGQRYDFEIRRGSKLDGSLVWQWSRGMMFTMMISNETLLPGKTLTYTTTFDPKSTKIAGGGPLASGIYTVIGTLTAGRPGARPQGTSTFRVK